MLNEILKSVRTKLENNFNLSEVEMAKMIEFTSENVKITGVEFRTDSKDYRDPDFNTVATYYTSWGREKDTCAWFWVSPSEKSRLESQGVEFFRT